MVALTDKEVQEFKVIVKKVKDIDLTDEEALDQGSRLITLFELLLKHKKTEAQNQPVEDSDKDASNSRIGVRKR